MSAATWLEDRWNEYLDFDLGAKLADRRSRAAEEKSAEERAAVERAAEARGADERTADERAADERAADERALEEKVAVERTAVERTAVERAAKARKSLVVRVNEWLRPRRLIISMVILGLLVVLFLVLLSTGNLEAFYNWLIGWSSEGKPWTHIMQEQPWIFWVGAVSILIVVFWQVPRKAFGRVWVITAGFLAGFLGGHVLW